MTYICTLCGGRTCTFSTRQWAKPHKCPCDGEDAKWSEVKA